MTDGLYRASRNDIATEFQGSTIHLLSTELSDTAGTTELNNNSEASQTTADGDWSISHDGTAGTTTLELSNSIDFGSPSGFTVADIVLESGSGGLLGIDNPSGDLDLSGDGTLTIEANTLSYTFG